VKNNTLPGGVGRCYEGKRGGEKFEGSGAKGNVVFPDVEARALHKKGGYQVIIYNGGG